MSRIDIRLPSVLLLTFVFPMFAADDATLAPRELLVAPAPVEAELAMRGFKIPKEMTGELFATIFADRFNKLEEGAGAGVIEHDGNIYYTCIPIAIGRAVHGLGGVSPGNSATPLPALGKQPWARGTSTFIPMGPRSHCRFGASLVEAEEAYGTVSSLLE